MSSLANPQLASSVNRLVTIVNFTVNMTGLQEQLLSLVVSKVYLLHFAGKRTIKYLFSYFHMIKK